jgi:hypothetical protein
MNSIRRMIEAHPRPTKLDHDFTGGLLAALAECEEVCLACADACLSESKIDMLRRCIRLNLDCADVCAASLRVLSRQSDPDRATLRTLVEACANACRACAEECEKHAAEHEHCRVCAEVCRHCERQCRDLVGRVGAVA